MVRIAVRVRIRVRVRVAVRTVVRFAVRVKRCFMVWALQNYDVAVNTGFPCLLAEA